MVRIILTDEESKLLKQFLLYFSMEEYNGFLGELNNKREEIDELLIDIYNQISEIIDSQKKSRIKFEIDEEYIQKAIWVKTVMGEI